MPSVISTVANIGFQNTFSWLRVLHKADNLDLLKFVWQSQLNIESINEFREALLKKIPGGDAGASVQSKGTAIFDNQGNSPSHAHLHLRIYHALLASKAVYSLAESLLAPSEFTTSCINIMKKWYTTDMKKYNHFDLTFKEHTKDALLFEPLAGDKGGMWKEGQEKFYIFAVKGTVTPRDWRDNLDSGDHPDKHTYLDRQGALMIAQMQELLRDLLKKGHRVVFTGHSAGGAVSSYVYKALYEEAKRTEQAWKMDCIVFGCAATDSGDEKDRHALLPKPSVQHYETSASHPTPHEHVDNLRLAFCNDGDPVPRATESYVKWFLHNWFKYFAAGKKVNFAVESPPEDTLVPYGQVVILDKDDDEPAVAKWMSEDQFRKTVYLDPTQHFINRYVTIVLSLLAQSGFKDPSDVLVKVHDAPDV